MGSGMAYSYPASPLIIAAHGLTDRSISGRGQSPVVSPTQCSMGATYGGSRSECNSDWDLAVKVGAFDHQPTPMCNHCARVA
ncbi:hypothetical protein DAI22_02g253800 [Oryza sativa Japonica Group]|nr:hypothetical protein DAI22_02g253800 [Oryza sativa Japonica Group]